jgi:hypothetical protein
MKPPEKPPLFLAPLAYPEFFSLGEQADSRQALRDAIGWTDAQLERKRRKRERAPVESVTEVTTED